jgi:MFS family permease
MAAANRADLPPDLPMPDTAPAPASALAPFRYRTFLEIWCASVASNFGGLIQGVGAAWLMTSLADSPDMVALVQSSTTLPIMLFSLAAGALADNFDRRRVMLAAQTFMLCVSAALAVAAWFGGLTPWTLLCFTFLIGCGVALNNPSWQASVGDIVPRADVPSAVALNSVGFNLTRSVGPAVGGAIIAASGPATAFAINAASYLPMLAALTRWSPQYPERALPRERLWPAMRAGLGYVAMSPNLGKVLLRAGLFGFSTIAVLALLPIVARDLVGGGPLTYGVLLGAFGVGAVGGAFAGARLRARLASETIVRLAFAGFAAAAAVAATSRAAPLTAAGLLVGGASWVLALSLFNTTVQLSTPRWVVGRALALYQTCVFGGMALGSWAWGVAARDFGADGALYGAAGAMALSGLVGFVLPIPNRTELNLDPLNRFKEPPIAIDLQPRSGPIAIVIEYQIDPADAPAFLDAMAERQRIRRRDGARDWRLLRDMQDPRLWLETYQTATWTDYVRYALRLTQADVDVAQRVRDLHRGEGPPRVRRMLVRQASWVRHEAAHRDHRFDAPMGAPDH